MLRQFTIGLGAAVVLSACATLDDSHGYIPDPALLGEIVVGLDTKTTVERIVGPPGTTGIVNDGGWYYVASEYERFLWRAPVETDREVLVIRFDDRARVSNIERFGLEAGRVVVLERRVTETGIKEIGLLQQLFSNFGRLDAGQLFDQN